jgi:hypothetical protein
MARILLGWVSSKHLAISKTGKGGISSFGRSPNTSAKNKMFSKIFPALLFCRNLAIVHSFANKKALHRITDERLCSTAGDVAYTSLERATVVPEKFMINLLIS